MSIREYGGTDGRTHIELIVQSQGSCNLGVFGIKTANSEGMQ